MEELGRPGGTGTPRLIVRGTRDAAHANGFVAPSDHLVRHLRDQWGWNRWTIGRVDERAGVWIVVATAGDSPSQMQPGVVVDWRDTLCARDARDGAHVSRDIGTVAVDHGRLGDVSPGSTAHATAAIRGADGGIAATICGVDMHSNPAHTRPLVASLQTYAKLLGLLLAGQERAEAADRRAERNAVDARTDPLTGLPNRRAWIQFLEHEEQRCQRHGRPVVVIVVDLDNLKPVNDRHGHAAGDKMLYRAATAISACTRTGDLAARIGGDEFGVVAVDCDAVTHDQLARRIERGLADADIPATAGAAPRRPDTGLHGAWHDADRAMYERKRTRPRDRDPSG